MVAPLRFSHVPAGAPEGQPRPARSYVQIFDDELGTRRLAIEESGATSAEVLQINKTFASAPGFERALRERVDETRHLQHASLAAVRSVEHIEGFGLCLVSGHTPGRRLSEFAPTEIGPAFTVTVIRSVTSALAVLHEKGLAHGTLTAEQIVVADEGAPVLVEHVFGPAIETLQLSRKRLNDSGLVLPAGDTTRFDVRTDMMQLGFLALSMFLRRPLQADGFPTAVPGWLDEFVKDAGSSAFAAKMRTWLERAMQLSSRSFASAVDAAEAFDQLPNEAEIRRLESALALLAFSAEEPVARKAAPPVVAPPPAPPRPAATVPDVRPAPADAHSAPVRAPQPPTPPPAPPTPVTIKPAAVDDEAAKIAALRTALNRSPRIDSAAETRRVSGRAIKWVLVAVSLVVIGQAVAIYWLASNRPPDGAPDVTPSSATNRPASELIPAPPPASPAVLAPPRPTGVPAAAAPPRATPASVPASPRTGRIAVVSPLELQVFSGGRRVGSTASPIVLSPGTHSLEFVNDAIGFRQTRTVTVSSGQTTPLNLPVPTGRLNINAIPWAEVTIDGARVGETPLGNVSLATGTHEIVFRHPRLGEHRQVVIVKPGDLLKVTHTFKEPQERR